MFNFNQFVSTQKLSFLCLLSLSVLISACTTTNPVVVDTGKDEVRKEIVQVIKFNRDNMLPPLDLTKYKSVEFKVITHGDDSYIVMTYDNYADVMELIQILGARNREQDVMIDEILKFYEQQLDR